MAVAIPYRSLPLGVAILAVLIGIVSAFFLIVGILLVLDVGLGPVSGGALYGVGLVAGAILLIIGGVFLAIAVGLWNLELWALVLCIIVVVLVLISAALRGTIVSLEGLLLIVLFVYLLAVNRHFR